MRRPRALSLLALATLLSIPSAWMPREVAAGSGTDAAPATEAQVHRDEERDRLWQLVRAVFEHTRRGETPAPAALAAMLERDCPAAPPKPRLAEVHRAEAQRWRNDLGLEFRGGYETEPDAGGDADPERGDDDGYLELSWDVLRSGYLENRDRARAAMLRAQLAEADLESARQQSELRCAQAGLEGRLAPLQSQLLSLKHELMSVAHRIERRAYFNGWSHLDELLVSESDLRLLRHRLSRLHGNPALRREALSAAVLDPAAIDVDMAALAARIESSPRRQRHAELERRLTRLERDERHNRLRVFLRQGFGSGESEDELSAGIRWSIPLGSMRGDQAAALEKRLAGVEAQSAGDAWRRATRAQRIYLELRDRLETVIAHHYRLAQARERLRRSLAAQRVSAAEADLGLAVTRARDLLDDALALAAAKEALYRQAIDLFAAARVEPAPELIETVPLPDLDDRRRTGRRTLYLWSEAWQRHAATTLLTFAEAKGIDSILLSPGADAERARLRAFLERARSSGLEVAIVKGDPRWVLPGHREGAVAKVRRAADLTGSVHLDIEPQALSAFDERPRQLLQAYLDLLAEIRAGVGNATQLSVALPLHWPRSVYRRAVQHVDAVYLMAYGERRAGKLAEWLRPALSELPRDQVRIVLRPADFSDEWQLEQTIETIARSTGIRHYAIHDAMAYMNFAADAP